MGNLQVVTRDLVKRFWMQPQDFLVFSRQSICPVSFGELEFACHLAPILFVREVREEEAFIPVLLLSPIPEQNLFLGPKGEWLARDIPWAFRGFPFTLGKTNEGNFVLLIDEEYLTETQKPNSFPLFQEDGTLSPQAAQIAQFLVFRERSFLQNKELATLLGKIGLLSPYDLVIDFEQEQKKIEGFYKLDLKNFSELDDQTFLELRQRQALHLAYAHLFSLTHLPYLISLVKFKLKFTAQKQGRKPIPQGVASASNIQETQAQDLEALLKEIKFPGENK